MAPGTAPQAYQEVRLDLDNKLSSAVVHLTVPATPSNAFISRSSPKRRRIERPYTSLDEDEYSSRYTAVESAIHFRPAIPSKPLIDSPRNISWRLLNDRRVLELQGVDLFRDNGAKRDSTITLRFEFETPVRPAGIAFAESDTATGSEPLLNVFVLCCNGDLHTLLLNRDAWQDPESLDEESEAWHSSCIPGAFSYRSPHRMLATSDRDLWFSMSDGGLIRLQRDSDQPSSNWKETFFTDANWKMSFKGLLTWKGPSVRFHDIDLQPKAAVQIEMSPDGQHVWSVCLDHCIRAWNVSQGKVVLTIDLAHNTLRDLEQPVEHLLDPNHFNLLQILPGLTDGSAEGYTVVTFSPDSRQFKFLSVRDPENTDYGISNVLADMDLTPPVEDLTGSSVWTLGSFHIKHDHDRRRHVSHLWTLFRSGSKSHILHIPLDLRDKQQQIPQDWKSAWVQVKSGLNSSADLAADDLNPANSDPVQYASESSDLSTAWLDFLFFPGRYGIQTLEAALSVYQRSLPSMSAPPRSQGPSNDTRPLRVRLSEMIASNENLQRSGLSDSDFDPFKTRIAAAWKTYFGIVQDLHKRREVVLSLSVDAAEDMPWASLGGFAAPLRVLTPYETLWYNRTMYAKADHLIKDTYLSSHSVFSNPRAARQLGKLFYALAVLRKSLSPDFLHTFQRCLRADISLAGDEIDGTTRLLHVYNASAFAGQISDEDYGNITSALQAFGGFDRMTTAVFESALSYLDGDIKGHRHEKRRFLTYGSRAAIRGAQEIIDISFNLVLDLILLAVFMGAELEPSDLPEGFDAGVVFKILASKLHRLDFLKWLSATQLLGKPNQRSTFTNAASHLEPASLRTVQSFLFESNLEKLSAPWIPQPNLLTYYAEAWTLGMRLDKEFDETTPYVLSQLLKADEHAAALGFVRFLPDEPWANYVKARLKLAVNEVDDAAALFQKNANSLSSNIDIAQADSASLLDLEERNYFNAGLTSFYQHVVSLFERAKAWTHVAYFADEALKAIKSLAQHEDTQRSDLQSRLFTAYLRSSCFSEAFEVLVTYKDLALRKSALQALVKALLSDPQTAVQLLELPIQPHAQLASDMDVILSTAANQSSTHPADELSPSNVQFHKLIYAWRIQRNDFRGAALILWERLQMLRFARSKFSRRLTDSESEAIDGEISVAFLSVINCLSLIEPSMAWMLVRPLAVGGANVSATSKQQTNGSSAHQSRKIVTIEDVRREWQAELDWRADTAAGRYPLHLEADVDDLDIDAMAIDGREGSAVVGVPAMPGAMEVDVFTS